MEVVDGDTLAASIEGGVETVRLAGVNAPEKGECHADRSRDRLARLLRRAPIELVELGRDRFGRVLAEVRSGGEDVSVELVRSGSALALDGAERLGAEEEAFSSGRGLWAADACGPAQASAFEISVAEADPAGPDQDSLHMEGVELANVGTGPVDMTGWVLRDGSSAHRYLFPEGMVIAPGETIRISSAEPRWDPGAEPVWNNSGDIALLLDPNGNVVARDRYPPVGG